MHGQVQHLQDGPLIIAALKFPQIKPYPNAVFNLCLLR